MATPSAFKLLCLPNPLLDIQALGDEALLKKYNLQPDSAILASETHMPLYEDLITNYSATVIAGGGSNIGRGAQYILPPDHVLFIGCIGSDHYGERLTAECSKAGVATAFRIDESMPTGRCGVIITGHHRSLCTNLGAANEYRVDHLLQPAVWGLVERAEVYYVEGYHLTVCVDAAVALGEEAAKSDKTLLFNFSAAFIPQVCGTAVAQVLPYADYVIGNETEAIAWAGSQGHGTTDIPEIARRLAKLPKKNQKRNRAVIITQGRNPTVSAVTKEGGDVDVNEHPVRVVASEKIKDTNGAGDAWAGGFTAGLVLGKTLHECIEMGHWLAGLGVHELGAMYPEPKQTYQPRNDIWDASWSAAPQRIL